MFNQLRPQARSLYYGRVLLEKKLKVLDESEELLDFLLKVAQARYPYNQSSWAASTRRRRGLAMHGNDHAQLYGQLRQNTIALNTLMARDPEGEFAVDTLRPPLRGALSRYGRAGPPPQRRAQPRPLAWPCCASTRTWKPTAAGPTSGCATTT